VRFKPVHIIILFIAAAIITLFITGKNKRKIFDDRITLRRQDKIPYGTWVAYRSLPHLFQQSRIYINREEPGYWDSIDIEKPNQAFIAITDVFKADNYEMRKLVGFAENGNDVFISARDLSYDVVKFLTAGTENPSILHFVGSAKYELDDSLEISLRYPQRRNYNYPGKSFAGIFNEQHTNSWVLGHDKNGKPNFIRLRAGKGNFYFHLAPLAFSNYFLLYNQNIRYYEDALDVLQPGVERIIWDEYFLRKRSQNSPRQTKKNWLSVFFRYPALRAALLTAMGALLVYVLLGMRRRQRIIPVITRPRNDSLDFVKTIGRLYYEKGDHKNLSRKMGAYFLEYVRSVYKLPTGMLDEPFIRTLQYKSGLLESSIRGIIGFIKYVEDAPAITDSELKDFYRQLEYFYKNA
jgi:hypothetical protein